MKKFLGGAGAAVGLKLLTGLAVAASAAVLAGAATEVAVTGSLNPVNWGQHVTQTVQTCKDTLRASGTRGIGQCVSAVAKQHGEQVSDSHQASKARENNGKDKSSVNDKSSGNGNGKDKSNGDSNGNGRGNGHKPSGNGGSAAAAESESSMLVLLIA